MIAEQLPRCRRRWQTAHSRPEEPPASRQWIRQMGAVFGVALVVVLVGNAFGPTAMNSFRIHFGVLMAGGR